MIVLLVSCQGGGSLIDHIDQSPMRSLTTEENQLVIANQAFGFNLMNQLNPMDTSKNVFISPLSVSFAFGMALNGASGSTYDAIRDVLQLQGLSEQQINTSFQSLMELLVDLDDKVLFEITNSMWYKNGFPVLNTFVDVNKQYFDADVRSLNFYNLASVDIINGWVADKTHNKIIKMLDVVQLDALMYLINAIYFKATWRYEFDKLKTRKADFHVDAQTVQQCDLMQTTAELEYFVDDTLKAVSLPYGDNHFQMTIILPSADFEIDAFATNFSIHDWTNLLANMKTGTAIVDLPKFKIEYTLLMKEVLKAMGMDIAFCGRADFSRIVKGGGIFINSVIHKTFVQVDEQGTEAAAVTVIEFGENGPGNFHIRVDQPFIFIIHEKQSGAILFMGKIKQP
jgi:serine protease inhibitor